MATATMSHRPEHPRPQWVRKEWLCLNGQWEFGEDAGDNGLGQNWHVEPRLRERIVAPFAPESVLSGIGKRDFMPCVWYARTFAPPSAWKDRRVLLHFGAVDYEADVWVNGCHVGGHRGGYTPFACEITDVLRKGHNQLVVRAYDDTRSPLQAGGKQSPLYASSGRRYTRTTGIWQSVWLEAVGRSYIASARFFGDWDNGRLIVQAVIDRPQPGTRLKVEALADGEPVGEGSAIVGGNTVACVVPLHAVRLWEVGKPFLYDLALTLADPDGNPIDSVESYFALRTITLASPAIRINGKNVFQRLVLDQGFYPKGGYTAASDEDIKRDIVLAQSLGFNGARLHQKVFDPRFLYWADRLGYIVWGEYPDGGIDHADGEAMRRASAEWAQAVQRDWNHPSVVGWRPFNETPAWKDGHVLRDTYRLTKALDPTRPVIDAGGYHHVETDVYDVHNYEQDPAKFAAAFAEFARGGQPWRNDPDNQAPYAGQPYFVSEYGGVWWNPGQRKPQDGWGYGSRPGNKEEFLDRYRRLTETLLKHPKVCGFCYTQLYDVEQEVNGLMSFSRKMKFDPQAIAAINRRRAAIEK